MAKTVSKQQITDAEVIKDTKVTKDVKEQTNAQQTNQEEQPVKVGWKDKLDEKIAKHRPAAVKVGKIILGVGAVALTGVIVKKVFFKKDAEIIKQVLKLLKELRDAWDQISANETRSDKNINIG